MSKERKQSTEAAARDIRRRTRRKFSPEEKIRIVLEGLRGEQSVACGNTDSAGHPVIMTTGDNPEDRGDRRST